MAAQKQTQLSWFFHTKWMTVRKSKNRRFRELFLPENDFKIKFSKKTSRFTNQRHEIQNWFFRMPFYIRTQYKNCFGHLYEHLQRALSCEGKTTWQILIKLWHGLCLGLHHLTWNEPQASLSKNEVWPTLQPTYASEHNKKEKHW